MALQRIVWVELFNNMLSIRFVIPDPELLSLPLAGSHHATRFRTSRNDEQRRILHAIFHTKASKAKIL